MGVISSDLVAVEDTALQDQLWALQYLFACNWQKGVTVRSSYLTDITKSFSDAEHRWGLAVCPYRTVEATLTLRGALNMPRFRSFLARAGKARWLVPLYSDQALLTGAGSGNTYTVRSTVGRRIQAGMRVAIVKFEPEAALVSVLQVSLVTAYSDTTVVIADAVNAGFGLNSVIYPLIEAQLELEANATVLTGQLVEFPLVAKESTGNMVLDPSVSMGSLPSGIGTFSSKLILNADPDYKERMMVGTFRNGQYSAEGLGETLDTQGDRPRWGYEMKFIAENRAEFKKLLNFFDAVGGRLYPFWLVSPLDDLQVNAITNTTIVVGIFGTSEDWGFFTHIAIVLKDGTVTIRGINSVARATFDTITVDALAGALPSSLSVVKKVCFAHLCRLDSDEFVEEWQTDGVMTTSLKCVEVIADTELTLDDIVDLGG